MTFDSGQQEWGVGPDDADAASSAPPPESPTAVRRLPRAIPGVVSLVLAVAAAVLIGIGVAVATSTSYLPATVIAYGAIALSVVAMLLGLVAVFTRRGAGWGSGGIALGALANPLVLVWVLDSLGQAGPA